MQICPTTSKLLSSPRSSSICCTCHLFHLELLRIHFGTNEKQTKGDPVCLFIYSKMNTLPNFFIISYSLKLMKEPTCARELYAPLGVHGSLRRGASSYVTSLSNLNFCTLCSSIIFHIFPCGFTCILQEAYQTVIVMSIPSRLLTPCRQGECWKCHPHRF